MRGVIAAMLVAASCGKGGTTHRVKAVCVANDQPETAAFGNDRGRGVWVSLLVALEGTETVTSVDKLLSDKENVGDKIPLRLLLSLDCRAFLPYEKPVYEEGRKRSSCTVTYLNLAGLDAGEPFSDLLMPRVNTDWAIRSFPPGLSHLEIGDEQSTDIRITGIHPFGSEENGGALDTRGAHISWEYAVGDGGHGDGASHVQLAADCPTTFLGQ